MTEIYAGYGLEKTYVGYVENGNIYQGSGINKNLVGVYVNNEIYTGYGLNKTYLGFVENGEIYTGHGLGKDLVGSCTNGSVYSGYGLNKNLVGTYNGYEGDIAAAALLLILNGMTSPSSISNQGQSAQSDHGRVPVRRSRSSEVVSSVMAHVMVYGALFAFSAMYVFLSNNIEYLSLIFYVAAPAIVLAVTLVKKVIKNLHSFNVKKAIIGAVVGFALTFIWVLVVTGFTHSFASHQVFNADLAIIINFAIGIFIGFISGSNK